MATGEPVLDAKGHILRVLDLADARVDKAEGVVVCSTIDAAVPPYYAPAGFPQGVLRPFDYLFYFFDIHANAGQRIRSHILKAGTSPDTPAVEPASGVRE